MLFLYLKCLLKRDHEQKCRTRARQGGLWDRTVEGRVRDGRDRQPSSVFKQHRKSRRQLREGKWCSPDWARRESRAGRREGEAHTDSTPQGALLPEDGLFSFFFFSVLNNVGVKKVAKGGERWNDWFVFHQSLWHSPFIRIYKKWHQSLHQFNQVNLLTRTLLLTRHIYFWIDDLITIG